MASEAAAADAAVGGARPSFRGREGASPAAPGPGRASAEGAAEAGAQTAAQQADADAGKAAPEATIDPPGSAAASAVGAARAASDAPTAGPGGRAEIPATGPAQGVGVSTAASAPPVGGGGEASPPAGAATGLSAPQSAAPPAGAAGTPPPPPPPRTAPLSVARQVAPVAIALSLVAGAQPSLRLALEPAELGRVEIRIARGEAGVDAVRILVERPETLALLQRDQRELGRALEGAGVSVPEGALSFGLGAGGEGAGGSGRDASARDGRASPGGPGSDRRAPAVAPAVGPAPSRAASGLALLDIAV